MPSLKAGSPVHSKAPLPAILITRSTGRISPLSAMKSLPMPPGVAISTLTAAHGGAGRIRRHALNAGLFLPDAAWRRRARRPQSMQGSRPDLPSGCLIMRLRAGHAVKPLRRDRAGNGRARFAGLFSAPGMPSSPGVLTVSAPGERIRVCFSRKNLAGTAKMTRYPRFRAAKAIPRPVRSFAEPPGFRSPGLAKTRASSGKPGWDRRTGSHAARPG